MIDGKNECIFSAADEGEPGLGAGPGIDPLEKDMAKGYLGIVRAHQGEERGSGKRGEFLPAGDTGIEKTGAEHGLGGKD